jgi:uncharacterized protein
VPAQQMSLISDLWKLQEIDSALDARRASLEDAEARLGESEQLLAARGRARELQESARRARTEQKDVELEADELRSKIAPLEAKLYGGTIRNPKELADLQADIDQLKRHLSSVEDRDLEALSALETTDSDLQVANAALKTLEAAAASEQRELAERIDRLRSEIETSSAERDEQAGHIDRATLKTYDHLRQAHQGRALAKLDRNLCLGCRISLPTSVVNKARAGNTLAHCPNCERILVA